MGKIKLSEDEVTKLPKSLIAVGTPLPFPVYDFLGQLLMNEGTVVSTEQQLEKLFERGLYLNKTYYKKLKAEQRKAGNPDDTTDKEKEPETEPEQKLVDLPLKTIKLGESIQISPLADNSNSIKYIVKFLGGLEKNSIICSAPIVDDKLVFIKEHTGFLVRLFSGKDVYNFTSIVSAVFNKPFPHIHLKFPSGVYSKVLRKNQRVQTSIICSLTNNSAGKYKDTKSAGRIIDISLGGAMIESNMVSGCIDDELECTFKLKLEDTEFFFSIPSILRNIVEPSKLDDFQKYKQGIQFKIIPFQEKSMLQNYIYQLLTGTDLNNL
jgi:c-di-GMP-binding flagellar brake protein YcgR